MKNSLDVCVQGQPAHDKPSMNKPFLPYALPELGEEEIAEVVDTLRSGWLSTGPRVKRFEADFAAYLKHAGIHCLAVSSATAGLHLALEALGVGPGDEVILPSYTFTATAEVVRYVGAIPVFVDVLEKTFNISPDAIDAAITQKTKAVIVVHFAGLSCDMAPIFALAKKNNLKIVEDAAHALPTTYQGRLVGTLESDFAVFSFYANKTMTTGEGGMVVTTNSELAARVKTMRLHGINRDAFDRYTASAPAWFYEVIAAGFKYNMPDMAAALGIHQLKKLDGFQKMREEMAQVYDAALQDLPLTLPSAALAGDIHARHVYAIRIGRNAPLTRDAFIAELSKRGIGTSVHFIPLHRHPYWRNTYSLNERDFPVSQTLYEEEVSLPLYTKMTSEDQERVIDAVRAVLEFRRELA